MPMTNAEKCRNYQMRKKAAKAAEAQQLGVPVKKPMTSTERSRIYRHRNKMMKTNVHQSQLSNNGYSIILSTPQPVTTTTTLNYSKSSEVSNTTVDQVDGNVRGSSLSTLTHDNSNFMFVQAEVHQQNSPVLCNSKKKVALTGAERVRRFRARRNNQQLTNTSLLGVISNQDILMDQELPESDTRGLNLNSPDQLIVNIPVTDQVHMDLSSSLPFSNYHQFKREFENGNTADAAQAHGSKPQTYKQKQREAGPLFGVTNLGAKSSETADKYDILGKYIASKVRQLEKKQRIFVERIINEAIFEGQMGTLNINSQLVVNTETFALGQSNDVERTGFEVPEIEMEKEDCARIKVEIDMEDPGDIFDRPLNCENEMDEESSSLDSAVLDGWFDTCSESQIGRSDESPDPIELILVDAPDIKSEVVTEEHNNLLENLVTVAQPNTTHIVESNCSDNAKRKRSSKTQETKFLPEPYREVIKEDNWNPPHSEDDS